ncbi:MAG: hypothetical protein V3U62_10535, partial [Sedimenticolaceae bacterium]
MALLLKFAYIAPFTPLASSPIFLVMERHKNGAFYLHTNKPAGKRKQEDEERDIFSQKIRGAERRHGFNN